MALTIQLLEAPTDEARALVADLEGELSAEYAVDQRHGLDIERLFRPEAAFVVARRDGAAVGCGGVAFESGLAELKRMYVRPSARGTGVADAILARLAEEARSRGFSRLALETGDVQRAAMRFYQRSGFVRCDAFGEYARMPLEAVRRSVFYEKQI